MKLLIHANSPETKSGYGVQCALLADKLASDGHEVAVSSTFPAQVGLKRWKSPSGHSIRVYPPGYLTSSDDVIQGNIEHWFGAETHSGWVITLIDQWSMVNPTLSDYNILAWTPVDHSPCPPGVLGGLDRMKARPVAMSRFGESALDRAGLQPDYVPLAVDTKAYKPTPTLPDGTDAREFFAMPADAFVVGMVAMNKDYSDRKGFQEAFMAFAAFKARHADALLWLHTDRLGTAGGVDLNTLAKACGISDSVRYTEQLHYRWGFQPAEMAALYSAFDVLLSPSAGEGFCVPLIEAQACGTPVIASDFTAQPELVEAGWLVGGQPWWDQSQSAWYQRADCAALLDTLEVAYTADRAELGVKGIEFAKQYDIDYVYDTYWRPLLAKLDRRPAADKPLMDDVAVLVPVLTRPQNVAPLVESFNRWNDGTANLYFVVDADDDDEIAAIKDAGATYLVSDRGTSFACKLNSGFRQTTESFVFCAGDDVEFTPQWLATARSLSDRYDVIGTNDAYPGETRNHHVAAGRHADHFFVRRSYVDELGACLDGPGELAAEAYYHYYTDVEIVELAKARGVWTPCLDSRVIHHQPRYEGRPGDWDADPVYTGGAEHSGKDTITWRKRAPLVEMQRAAAA